MASLANQRPRRSCAICQLACAAKRGFAIIKYVDQQPTLKYLSRPLEHDPDRENAQRFNDGACDARGRFFAGTLETLDPPYAGQLWCFDPLVGEGKARLVDGDIHVSQRVLCLESDGKKAEGADGVCKGKQWHGMES